MLKSNPGLTFLRPACEALKSIPVRKPKTLPLLYTACNYPLSSFTGLMGAEHLSLPLDYKLFEATSLSVSSTVPGPVLYIECKPCTKRRNNFHQETINVLVQPLMASTSTAAQDSRVKEAAVPWVCGRRASLTGAAVTCGWQGAGLRVMISLAQFSS